MHLFFYTCLMTIGSIFCCWSVCDVLLSLVFFMYNTQSTIFLCIQFFILSLRLFSVELLKYKITRIKSTGYISSIKMSAGGHGHGIILLFISTQLCYALLDVFREMTIPERTDKLRYGNIIRLAFQHCTVAGPWNTMQNSRTAKECPLNWNFVCCKTKWAITLYTSHNRCFSIQENILTMELMEMEYS